MRGLRPLSFLCYHNHHLRRVRSVKALAQSRNCMPYFGNASATASLVTSSRSLSMSAVWLSPTATAAADASLAHPISGFTSFEFESELLLAAPDLAELRPPSNLSAATFHRSPGLASSLHIPSKAEVDNVALEGLHDHEPKGEKAQELLTTASAETVPSVARVPRLSPLLFSSRWRHVVHERYRDSAPGYVEAAKNAYSTLLGVWTDLCGEVRAGKGVSDGGMEDATQRLTQLIHTYFAQAHSDALLVVLEHVVEDTTSPHNSTLGATATTNPTSCHHTLLLCVVQLLYRRHAELSGKHVAHLSRLLLRCPHLFLVTKASPSSHDRVARSPPQSQVQAVWNAFTLLAYATRRTLRRQQNRDCLEVFLWGVYRPKDWEEGGAGVTVGQRRRRRWRQLERERKGVDAFERRDISPQLMSVVRQATLQHLLHRSLETPVSTKARAAAAASSMASADAELVLSWALLLASDEMSPPVRDAVIHRLCKTSASKRRSPAASSSLLRENRKTAACVEQWKELALRGRHGKALLPGARVFARVDQDARDTAGWAVPAMDRRLVCALTFSTAAKGVREAEAVDVKEKKGSIGAATCSAGVGQHTRATNALQAYIQLRWEPLLPLPYPASSQTALSRRRPSTAVPLSCAEALEELVHTALELPKHAWCLSEVLVVRLLSHWHQLAETEGEADDGDVSRSHRPTSLTQRQLEAAFEMLARHSRPWVISAALLRVSNTTLTTATPDGVRVYHSNRDDDHLFLVSPLRTSSVLACVADNLHTTEDVLYILQEALHRPREMACTPLAVEAVEHVRAWVTSTVPAPLQSEMVVAHLAKVAETQKHKLHTSKDESEQQHQKDGEKERNLQAERAAWDGVIGAASTQVPAREGDITDATQTSAPSHSWQNTALHETSSAAIVAFYRLQWAAYLTATPIGEWYLCAGSAEAATHGNKERYKTASTVANRSACLVAASEAGALTPLEEQLVHALCRRHGVASSWQTDRHPSRCISQQWQWLDDLFTKEPQEAAVALLFSYGALTPMADAPPPEEEPSLLLPLLLSQIGSTKRFWRPDKGQGSETDTPWTALPPSALAESKVTSLFQATQTLWVLADYATYLRTRVSDEESSGGNGGEGERKDACNCLRRHRAVCGFIAGIIRFWKDLRTFSLSEEAVQGRISSYLWSELTEHYTTALRLYLDWATSVRRNRSCSEVEKQHELKNLPNIPDTLQRDVFDFTLQGTNPEWESASDLLLLADRVTTAVQGDTFQTAASPANEQQPFCVPSGVYVEVVATYAARQVEVPPLLYDRCRAAFES